MHPFSVNLANKECLIYLFEQRKVDIADCHAVIVGKRGRSKFETETEIEVTLWT